MATTTTLNWSMADARDRTNAAQGAPASLDEAGFERFYARTSRPLWTYLRRAAGDPAVADDVHQESYLRYLAHPCPVAGERQEKAYLFRIASNLLRDLWRRQKRERGWLERARAGEEATARNPVGVGLKVDVETVLGALKPRQRALLWLAYVEGHQHQEIAQILDLKAASVRVLLFRARRRLAALLRQHGLEPEIQALARGSDTEGDVEVRR